MDERRSSARTNAKHSRINTKPKNLKPATPKPVTSKTGNPKQANTKPLKTKPAEPKLSFFYSLVLLGYSFITVLTPNLNTLDSNGPKFYTLAILNLVAYSIILIGNQLKPHQDFQRSFFRTLPGFVYTLFLLVALLSFFKASNGYEAIISFSKLFTVFSAAYIVSIILRKDKRYLYVIAISLAFLLIFESLTVLYQIGIQKMTFWDVKSVYSNKNILASAIFVKIAFVLWLLSFGKGWMKVLGGFTLLLAFVAIVFMGTRAFYIGSIFLVSVYSLFLIIRFFKKNEKRRILIRSIYVSVTVIIVFLAFSLVMKHRYPELATTLKSGYVTFVERWKTLKDEKRGMRLQSWQNSFRLIRSNPLFGVGTGNWKVEVLKYETPMTGEYIYMYKNHNDFIETTAETGLIGGALFLGIFMLIFADFIKAFFKAKKGEESSFSWLFLPAFGLLCYSFDAFFNFPSDRPEILSFFAIFAGAGIAFSPLSSRITHYSSLIANRYSLIANRSSIIFHTVFLFLLLGSIYIFYLNFESLKLQRIANKEFNAGTLTSKSELFLNGFPAIPNINAQGEPIAITKARYLDVEGKNQQVIDLLQKDNSSPYDTRREFFIAIAFLKLNQPDSALVYALKVYRLKPFFSGNIRVMSIACELKGDFSQAVKVLDDHVQLNNKNNIPVSDFISAQQTHLSAQYGRLSPRAKTQQFREIFSKAVALYSRKEYNNATHYFSELIDTEPGIALAFEYRAWCYFNLGKYQLSLTDVNRAIALDPSKQDNVYLKGLNQQMLGK